jgi:lipopolysaccharide biosynthesis regulator YciM
MPSRTRRMLLSLLTATTCAAAGGWSLPAHAGEEDDLQSRIETQRAGVADLEKMYDLKAVPDETTLLRAWLDVAWSLRSKHEYDQVREVLDRATAQAELIRAKITASKLRAQAQKHEAAVQELKARIAKTRKALSDTITKKKVLEGSAQ